MATATTTVRRVLARVYADGASRANPGHASYGVYIEQPGCGVRGEGCYLGTPISNNTAEFAGVERALELVAELLVADGVVRVYTDSRNLAEAIAGRFAVRAEHLQPIFERIRTSLATLNADDGERVTVEHVRRGYNRMADALANAALDARGPVRLDVGPRPRDFIVPSASATKRSRP